MSPVGEIVTQVYNSVGQRVAVVNPLGQGLSLTYNANGIVQSVQNPLGAITTFLRDPAAKPGGRAPVPRPAVPGHARCARFAQATGVFHKLRQAAAPD